MSDTLNYAGDFRVEKAEILTSNGSVIDVLPFLLHVTIFEDIFTPRPYNKEFWKNRQTSAKVYLLE